MMSVLELRMKVPNNSSKRGFRILATLKLLLGIGELVKFFTVAMIILRQRYFWLHSNLLSSVSITGDEAFEALEACMKLFQLAGMRIAVEVDVNAAALLVGIAESE